MLGTIVNTACIAAGSIAGSVLHRGLNEKYSDALFTAMGLAAAGLGINTIVKYMPKSQYPVLFIVSLALGILIGAMLDLDGRFNRFVSSRSGGNLAQGLSTGIMLYCMGALSILGPIQSALYGDNTFLFTNATLDLITSAVLASTYGIGMIFAAPVLFCWQGGIYLLALWLGNFMSDALMAEISIVGGFMIAASGLSILKMGNFKTMNMLPALAVPPLWFILLHFIH
ncbi:MAG: DUF554 domain-containing protein [Firmicutes bacterium]|nr:DUF554 domain-containing protein [Bacillota bacterium]